MATVVQLPEDPRFKVYGEGVAKFLNRMRETRLDKTQQDLMNRISEAPDEATAAALLADPAYQEIVTDPQRFALIDRHLTNAQPGQQTLQGYNDAGEQIFFSVRQGTPIEQRLWDERKLHVAPEVPFYVTNPDDPESLPTLLGHFRSRREAAVEAGDKLQLSETSIFNAAEAQMEMTRAVQTGQARRANAELGLSKERLELAKTNPSSAVGQVMDDWRKGTFGDPSTPEATILRDRAIERIVAILGRTPDDVSNRVQEDLVAQGAAVHNLTRQGMEFVNQIRENPALLSKVGALDRFAANISSELEAATQIFGIRKMSLDNYDFGDFAPQSTAFKNMMVNFAVAYAASKGIKGRDLSNQEFEKFLGIVGADISNPESFVVNMATLLSSTQEDFLTTYGHFQTASGGVMPDYEATYGEFDKVELTQETITQDYIRALEDRLSKDGVEINLERPPWLREEGEGK